MDKMLQEGISDKEVIKGGSKAPLRSETNDMSQRPVSKSEKVTGDDGRGSFTCK